MILIATSCHQPRNWKSCPGGQNLLAHSLWRGKSLFPYINLQVTASVGEGAKPCQSFHLGAMPPVAPCRYVPACPVRERRTWDGESPAKYSEPRLSHVKESPSLNREGSTKKVHFCSFAEYSRAVDH